MAPPEDNDTKPYPQLNLNTGLSLGLVLMLGGLFYHSVGVKNDVAYHELRITSIESTIKELRTTVDSTRLLTAQAETRLESRLVRMEIILQDLHNRIGSGRRDPIPPQ